MRRDAMLMLASGTALIGIALSAIVPLPAPTLETPTGDPRAANASPAGDISFPGIPQTVQRSLFRAVQPPPAVPAAAPDLPPPGATPGNPAFRLTGLVLRGRDALALIEVQGNPEAFLGRAGDTVEGWTIRRIGLRDVQLNKGDQHKILKLDPVKTP